MILFFSDWLSDLHACSDSILSTSFAVPEHLRCGAPIHSHDKLWKNIHTTDMPSVEISHCRRRSTCQHSNTHCTVSLRERHLVRIELIPKIQYVSLPNHKKASLTAATAATGFGIFEVPGANHHGSGLSDAQLTQLGLCGKSVLSRPPEPRPQAGSEGCFSGNDTQEPKNTPVIWSQRVFLTCFFFQRSILNRFSSK